jgi:Peptidase propeptide and YPEB domain
MADADGRAADGDRRAPNAEVRSRSQAAAWQRPTWPKLAAIGAVLVLAFFVSRSCQQSQIRVTKEQAIATAEEQVDFSSENTQIRLLRQGLSSKPFWIVSLSVPSDEGENSFSHLALVRIDANTGEIAEVQEGRPAREAQQRQR